MNYFDKSLSENINNNYNKTQNNDSKMKIINNVNDVWSELEQLLQSIPNILDFIYLKLA